MKYSVKMRASKNIDGKDFHISGAERIVDLSLLYKTVENLEHRALNHEKGSPDLINIKIERVQEEEILHLKPLEVKTVEVNDYIEGLDYIENFLRLKEIKNAKSIVELLKNTSNMRGAIILDVNTLERLEYDKERGIRVTYMDYENSNEEIDNRKNHFLEALVLATKVSNAPNIVAELCVSDDPYYVTGYVASKEDGYVRITKVKEFGSEKGARIFLYDGNRNDLDKTIEFLEKRKVLISE